MAIYINGTTGISGVDGSAGTPAVQGTDTNTGVFYPAADTVGVSTGGSERMRIDSSGNVGIGTSSPNAASKLEVSNGSAAANCKIRISNSGTYGAYIESVTSNRTFQFGGVDSTNGFASGAYGVYDATAGAWRMVIDSSGYVGIGTTSPSSFGYLAVEQPNNVRAGWFYVNVASSLSTPAISLVKKDNNTTTSQVLANFYVNGSLTAQGQINANGASAAAFGSFSDSRLKENIVDLPPQLANIMALRTVEFDYIESEGGGHQIGFIAQEVQQVYPDLVGEREDGMLTLTDLNKNDARLIKAVQELKALVDTQASTITQLQADIATLKGQA